MSNAADMLRSLAGTHSVGRTGMRPANAASNSQNLQGADFGALLEQARSGNVESGVPIRVPKHLGLQLDQSQNDRLAKAMDQADMQGAGRALVLMDGMALTMDVGTRTVTGVVDAKSPGVLDGIDTVVVASQDPNAKTNDAKGADLFAGTVGMPKASPSLQPNLLKALNRDDDSQAVA